ncbi:MAG: hypothetical protein ABIB79_00455, partial [archaeon]
MGLIRGGLLTVICLCLFVTLFFGNLFLSISWSLEYDTIKPELVGVVKELGEKEIGITQTVNNEYPAMQTYCQNNSDYVFKEKEYLFEIPCSVVGQGPDAIIDHSVNSFVDEYYYKDYECNGLSCIKEIDSDRPFILVSEKTKNSSMNWFYITLILSIIFVIVSFILIESKTNFPFVIGGLLLLSSLPYIKIEWLVSWIVGESFLQFFTIFFTKAYNVFLITFFISIGILLVGVALKFWKFGNWFSK